MRRAATLVEATVVLAIAGVLMGIAVVPAARLFDAVQTRAAVAAVAAACALARQAAIARGERTEVAIDAALGRVAVVAGADTLLDERLGARFGVTLESSGARVRYGPTGHGWGLANLRVVARRGRSADTLTVSRLGRVRPRGA